LEKLGVQKSSKKDKGGRGCTFDTKKKNTGKERELRRWGTTSPETKGKNGMFKGVAKGRIKSRPKGGSIVFSPCAKKKKRESDSGGEKSPALEKGESFLGPRGL